MTEMMTIGVINNQENVALAFYLRKELSVSLLITFPQRISS
jgi:hypothetical protein